MATMTYKFLAELIKTMTPEQQNSTVTLFVPGVDEYYPATIAYTDKDCDVLDPDHPIITPE